MARSVNRLTARSVATIATRGLHTDGGGLYLRVGDGEARSWVYIYRRLEKRTELGLGSVRDVTLAAARAKAANLRKSVLAGEDPKALARQSLAPTFGQLADEYIVTHAAQPELGTLF